MICVYLVLFCSSALGMYHITLFSLRGGDVILCQSYLALEIFH